MQQTHQPSAQLGQHHQFFDAPGFESRMGQHNTTSVFNNNVEQKHGDTVNTNTDNMAIMQQAIAQQRVLANPHLNHEAGPGFESRIGHNPNFPHPPPAHQGFGKYENHPMIAPPQITLKKPRVTFNSHQVVKLEHEFKSQR